MKPVLARLRTAEGLRWVAAAVLVVFALTLPPLSGVLESVSPDTISANFALVLGTSALVLALWSVSYNLMLGYTGMVSFAHAAYYGIGAYTVALLYQDLHWSVLPGLALSPLVAGLAGLITGFISLRAVRLYFALLTLAISQVCFVIAFEWYSFTGGDNGIHGISPPDFLINPTAQYYFVAAVVGVCLLIMFSLVRSPFGAALLAIRENRLRAASVGLDIKRYELAVFTISAAFAGVAGGLFTHVGRWQQFWGLILPHGLLELSAVIVAGAAGLRIGWTVIDPGDRRRMTAIAEEGRRTGAILVGLVGAFAVAALIEGFVTGSGWPTPIRVGIGVLAFAVFWGSVLVLGPRAEREELRLAPTTSI